MADAEVLTRAPTDAEREQFEDLKQGIEEYRDYALIGVEDCPHGLRFWAHPPVQPCNG